MKVLQFPLTRITIAFVIGILVVYNFELNYALVFYSLLIAVCSFVMVCFVTNKTVLKTTLFSVIIYFAAFIIGVTTQISHTHSFQKSNYSNKEGVFDRPHLVFATVLEKLRGSSYNDRFIIVVNQIDQSVSSGKILLNIQKDSLNNSLKIGNHIQVNSLLYKNSSSKNPNQFDYNKYLENKQIYAQIYTDATSLKIGSLLKKDVWYYTSKLRSRIITNLENVNFSKAELNVAVALILGQTQEISSEIIRDYQYAGAVHILSVSGLHIGFILLFVHFLLKPIPNNKRGSLIKLIIILVSLFSFGLMAGLAPPVLRSITMFSFVAIGMFLRRSTYIFHTLLVSILLILLFEPSFLFDVGFQLSYVALFSILWLQPLLSQLWIPKYKILKYFWDILTVSFAAQIGTLPLCIYYFHQFPGLFFVTNLVVIPLLSLILALGVLVVILASFGFVPLFLAKPLEFTIYILNKIINSIASLEQFIIQQIPFNWQLLLVLYIFIITILFWFKKPNFNRLVVALFAIIMLQYTYFQTHWTIQKQKELVVFNSKKNSLITERNGKNVILYTNGSILNTASEDKNISSYLLGNFSRLQHKEKLRNLLFFNGKKILILDSLGIYQKNIRPDIVVLTQSPKINFDRFLQIIKPTIVVADATNFKNLQKSWKTSCIKHNIPFHATGEKGYYRLN